MNLTFSPIYPIFDSVQWFERLLPVIARSRETHRMTDRPMWIKQRQKTGSEAELRQSIRLAEQLCRAHDCQLIVNDYWQWAIDEGCRFVHLGQEDLDVADVSAIRAAGIALGVSTHSHEELRRAQSLQPEYIALGPIYPTILKSMSWQPQGLQRITEWKSLIGHTPLVAIGGMNLERAAAAWSAGADSVAMVTDVLLHPQPELRMAQWFEQYAQHRAQHEK